MIATGGALAAVSRAPEMGLTAASRPTVDLDALRARIEAIEQHARASARGSCSTARACASSGAPAGSTGPHEVVVDTADGPVEVEADAILLATGSRPRLPDWADVDGDRVLSTRDAYPPPDLPEHLVVIGSGVTGVEFVHMFSSLGAEVTLIVSPPAGAAPEGPRGRGRARGRASSRRGVHLLKGARAVGDRPRRRRRRRALRRRPDARRAATRCWRSARSPTARASTSTPPASRSTGRLRARRRATA